MKRILFDHTGSVVSEVFADDTQTIYRTTQNVDALLAEAKQAREDFAAGPRAGARDFIPVAKIPQAVVDQALREGWFDDRAKWKAWLNSSENSAFRIYTGTV